MRIKNSKQFKKDMILYHVYTVKRETGINIWIDELKLYDVSFVNDNVFLKYESCSHDGFYRGEIQFQINSNLLVEYIKYYTTEKEAIRAVKQILKKYELGESVNEWKLI